MSPSSFILLLGGSAVAATALGQPAKSKGGLALTPPMGWMSWEIFRCHTSCTPGPPSSSDCIDHRLYESMTDALVDGGFLAAGYNGIHLDDCWMQRSPIRDPTTNELVPDPSRFPAGFKALGDYMHKKSVKFAIYTAESPHTCAGYPASAGHEELDAKTFASWGVDYVKVDGCGDAGYYATGYPAMGKALVASGRDIVFSCSWPAYLGRNETAKPYDAMIAANCNLWRNSADIQCSWGSLSGIISHYGDYSQFLQTVAGPDGPNGGHWNDADMLLAGNDCITDDEARTQLSVWSILAAPLIMGNDLRKISASATAILTNKEVIAVDQDVLGRAGIRVSQMGGTEIWARNLSNGAVAVALVNMAGSPTTTAAMPDMDVTHGGYPAACGGPSGNEQCTTAEKLGSVTQAEEDCCRDPECAGFSWPLSGKGGVCFKKNQGCWTTSTGYSGYEKVGFTPPPTPSGSPTAITVNFSDVWMSGAVSVRDLWEGTDNGTHTESFTWYCFSPTRKGVARVTTYVVHSLKFVTQSVRCRRYEARCDMY
eukprot:CAMPEP_0206294606 /NCGR_PEP_ID=MMETSP0106_2-20121207/4745_1 /ASSEMBLY_ACC=CAM_ASM_000206 /TAXON_ID=81532 /ORGANISM="Acanthoeca-like sp., Strain 10tr" /LENGTH=538 /DNA_ID=CAMNT_0053725249 /DNA_START=20 /DNA_END=1634 /DNA_ORIENTATION=+